VSEPSEASLIPVIDKVTATIPVRALRAIWPGFPAQRPPEGVKIKTPLLRPR
jgi:hypothetical protein